MRNKLRHIVYPILIFLSALACKKDKTADDHLHLIVQYYIDVPECSGLCVYTGNSFLTVSDSLSKVYVINQLGNVLDSLSYIGHNLEGVTFNPVTGQIFVVEENSNEVVELDSLGNEVSRFHVELDNQLVKHGLEGISCSPVIGHLFIVSEKYPGLLIELTAIGEEICRKELSFADDYASVFFDEVQNKLWILSDDSETLSRCDLSGNAEKTWQTGVKKGEGVVVDSVNSRIYIITDSNSAIYTFSF
jgi:uncharacterized protein YjiK